MFYLFQCVLTTYIYRDISIAKTREINNDVIEMCKCLIDWCLFIWRFVCIYLIVLIPQASCVYVWYPKVIRRRNFVYKEINSLEVNISLNCVNTVFNHITFLLCARKIIYILTFLTLWRNSYTYDMSLMNVEETSCLILLKWDLCTKWDLWF